jgi:hypothetical protein
VVPDGTLPGLLALDPTLGREKTQSERVRRSPFGQSEMAELRPATRGKPRNITDALSGMLLSQTVRYYAA